MMMNWVIRVVLNSAFINEMRSEARGSTARSFQALAGRASLVEIDARRLYVLLGWEDRRVAGSD